MNASIHMRDFAAVAHADNRRLVSAGAWYRYAIDGILTCAQCGAHEMADGKPMMRATMRRCPACGHSGGKTR